MQIYKYPAKSQWSEVTARPTFDNSQLRDLVNGILTQIKEGGDRVIMELEENFDHCQLTSLQVQPAEFDEARTLIEPELAEAINRAYQNIAAFHESQHHVYHKVETQKGVQCWQKAIAIDRVGLYIPGGTAPLFSTVLMLAIPAKIAGCGEIVLCTPPNSEGKVNPASLYASCRRGV